MSFATLIGFLAGIGLFIGAIMTATDNYLSFVSLPSIVMVLGGTLAAGFIGYQARYVMLALKDVGGLFVKGKVDRKMLTIETGKIIRWGYLVKKQGLLALEREIKGAKKQDHFMNYGIELVITGYSGEEVRAMPTTPSTPQHIDSYSIISISGHRLTSSSGKWGFTGGTSVI